MTNTIKKYRITLESTYLVYEEKGSVVSRSTLHTVGIYTNVNEAIKRSNEELDKCIEKGYQVGDRFSILGFFWSQKIQASKDYATLIFAITTDIYYPVDMLLSAIEDSIYVVKRLYGKGSTKGNN